MVNGRHEIGVTKLSATSSVAILKCWYGISSFKLLRFKIMRLEPTLLGLVKTSDTYCPGSGSHFEMTVLPFSLFISSSTIAISGNVCERAAQLSQILTLLRSSAVSNSNSTPSTGCNVSASEVKAFHSSTKLFNLPPSK